MCILAVDPGTKILGIAISDPTGTIARPLTTLAHASRERNANSIVELAQRNHVEMIVVGQSFDEDGHPNLEGRRAARLAEALRARTGMPVVLWDESLTTQDARQIRIAMGVSRKKRSGHLDELAAAILLQSFLDARQHPTLNKR